MGFPPNGWFIMGNSIEMDDNYGYPHYRNPQNNLVTSFEDLTERMCDVFFTSFFIKPGVSALQFRLVTSSYFVRKLPLWVKT